MAKLSRCLLPVLLLTLVAPAAADRLVTSQGEILETQGPWKVEGRMVVFTNATGELVAIRVSEVDLKASKKATEEASKPPQPPTEEVQEEGKKAVFVLADKDVRKARPVLGPDIVRQVAQEGEQDAEVFDEAYRLVVEAAKRVSPPADPELRSVEGLRRNAGYFTALAAEFRRAAGGASPGARAILQEAATRLDFVASMARSNPEFLLEGIEEVEKFQSQPP